MRFGEDINTILDRDNYGGQSILQQYYLVLQKFRQYYQHEKIIGSTRETINQIPEETFREAVANASPGGLPEGMTVAEYLSGQLSILRNPIIANVFFRLGLIEQFGTGVKRIQNSYKDSVVQPKFDIGENHIRITLPVVQVNIDELSADENKVYRILQTGEFSTTQIAEKVDFGRTKTLHVLNTLIDKGCAIKKGNGRSIRYTKSN